MRRIWAGLLLVPLLAGAATEREIALDGLQLAGSAHIDGTALRLTDAGRHQAGAAWLSERQAISGGFESTFQFRISGSGGLGGGADGLAFVLQNSGPQALGGRGSGGGFAFGEDASSGAGIAQSVAIFFDTYRNEEIGDRSNNFVTICTAGTPSQLRWPPPRLASSKKLRVNLKNGKIHDARVVYAPPLLKVYLDGREVLRSTADLSTAEASDGTVWAGFTASTGEGYENHDILSWSLSVSGQQSVSSSISFLKAACLPDRNLCTPDHAVVEPTGAASYHIVLPGNLAGGVSIPNPGARTVTVENARGNVCGERLRAGASLTGPGNAPGAAGPGSVAPRVSDVDGCRGPSALVERNQDGRTWFSADGAAPSAEGYLEFDARVE